MRANASRDVPALVEATMRTGRAGQSGAVAVFDTNGNLITTGIFTNPTQQTYPITVIATDARGVVTFLNEVAQNLTGWTLEAAKGKSLREVFQIVNEQTRDKVESPVERCLTGPAHELEVVLGRHLVKRPLSDAPQGAAPPR